MKLKNYKKLIKRSVDFRIFYINILYKYFILIFYININNYIDKYK